MLSYEEQFRIEDLREVSIFDHRVSNEAYPVLAEVIQKRWRVEYESTKAMLRDAKNEYLKVNVLVNIWPRHEHRRSRGTDFMSARRPEMHM